MKRRTAFASPFVVTIACGGSPVMVNPPPPVPEDAAPIDAIAIDEAVAEVPIDAAPVSAKPPVEIEGALVVQPSPGGPCYLVYERDMRGRTSRSVFDEGAVPCPPNVKLPSPTQVTIGPVRYRLDLESLHCVREVPGNPPGWRESQCPPPLLPELVGLTPDENCEYRGVVVSTPNCNPKEPARKATKARVIAVNVVADGTRVVIGAGTDAGVTKGATLRIRNVGIAKIVACTARTCEAVFHATPDQIRQDPTVTIED